MPYYGPWLQSADQTIVEHLAPSIGPGNSVLWEQTFLSDGHLQNDWMWDGHYDVDTGAGVQRNNGPAFVYETQPTPSFERSVANVGIAHIMFDGIGLDDVADPYPTGPWLSVEFDPSDTSEITSAFAVNLTVTADPPDDGAYPSDMSVVLKRLAPAMYADGTYNEITLTTANLIHDYYSSDINPWLKPEDVAPLPTFAEIAPVDAATSTSMTLTPADADAGRKGLALWIGINYFTTRTLTPAHQADAHLDLTVTYTYRPRRHRFLYDARPPLAHRQRLDGTDTAGAQLAHVGTAGGRPPLAWRQNTP